MLFKLPDPPAGQVYVNKVTANGPTTVLVDKSSLSEDICTATGRTWAEEARLYNIRNAPDGKQIAEPGDPFYQTADSMKNRSKDLGGITAKSLGIFNQVAGTTPGATPPNLSETIDKIKSGAINADITANLSKIGEVAGSLPSAVSSQLNAAKADIAAKMAEAQAQLPKLLAMAQSNVDILTKKKIAETGQPPSEAEIKAAQGALTIFQDGPKLLESKAGEISKAVAQAGTDFGAALNKGLSAAQDFTKAGIGKVTDLAKTAGAKISQFASSVPTQTIPDPNNPGQTIPNPAFASFSANPANALKLTKLTDIKNKMEGAAADMMSKFGAIEEKQATAVAGGMAELKAFAFAAQLSQPATGLKATVQDFTLKKDAFNPASISQTFAQASKLGPSIDTSLYKNTKDEDLTYKGDDGIVWDRTNAERLRRSLPGLAAIGSPRPPEPPLVPAGPTPPKDPATTPVTVAKEVPAEPPATVTTKVGGDKKIMGQDPTAKIYQEFLNRYLRIVSIYDNARKKAELQTKDPKNTLVEFWYSDATDIDYATINKEARRITAEKTDPATRTDEEKEIVKQRNFYRDIFTNHSQFFLNYRFDTLRRNQLAQQYNIVFDAFQAGKTFADLPPSVEDALKLDPDRKSVYPTVYISFGEFRKANPDQAVYKA